ncbi:putative dehydrogenase [Dysgonomonas sp. PFB1-18]|uniref:Gfo/Idh/MocA family protein n=1 Tax=unclassified Dysgonomonas TaxID=2630389 RepID=UPI002476A096|nr:MULTISPECIES: Gfo/Idh/MocA family oxidoreductase [unclassified Dysgonomonas]MDH6309510.1 putative dehydrogenase [Dysgonomonas sp. PF1-14]MDH6339162.1 putative dehydrogenase [Dysgonomonas sp. PF1-16]MDH6380551.1 putative dehydrogenase [Dysgonomonas sp. PFB1-18]MDH6398047.1 putative dehydrogenase [Dysgonomonas sp. PF1-23]
MKKITSILLSLFTAGTLALSAQGLIKTPTPVRPAGQTDVLELKTAPISTVRVAFIGLGMRGPGAVQRMTHIPGVEVVALCDVLEKNTKKVNDMLEKRGFPKAQEFYGDTSVWRKVTKLPDVDLIYVATDWKSHATIGIQAMKDGKHVAIEVPSAMTMDEIWGLINTSEQTRKHCMQLENCVYDFFELTTLNMVQQGLLGEVMHGEGAYIHGLQPFWDEYWNDWRMDFNKKHRGDVYPTHGLGPVCQAMNIHRGDKMNYLVSMDTKAVSNPAFLKKDRKENIDAKNFRNGDHTMTMIRTEKGKTIMIQHDVTSPRPYNRMYQISGTKGFANKYPVQGFALGGDEIGSDIAPNHEDLNAHSFVSPEVRKALMEKYKHPIAKDIEEQAKKVGGHGGMDFIMDYRLIYCLQKGLPLDMDVYDLAEWCCLIPLTEISLDNNSAPVEIPDFTRGGWNRLQGLKFAE